MATKKQQEKKKKARELKGKARAESRRHKLQIIKKEEMRAAKLNNKFKDKIVPFVKDPEKRKLMDEIEEKKALRKLERNMEVLKALEEEYLKEKEQKRILNESLESEGHFTLEDKIKALDDKAKSLMADSEKESGHIDLTASPSTSSENTP